MSSQTGNAQALPITNQDFLKAIFGNSWYLCHVTGFAGDPQDVALPRSVWEGGSAGSWVLSPQENNYFSVSLFTGRRDQQFFDKLIVLAVDDVGPKVSAEKLRALPVKPTFRIETSPGNEQWGYVLAEPVTVLPMATALIDAMARYVGINDARGVTRYIRLPVGGNGKPAAQGWHCRLLELGSRITPEGQTALALVLSVALTSSDELEGSKVVPGPGGAFRGAGPEYDDLCEHDRWVHALRKLDLVQGRMRKSPIGRCFDIVCPWVDEHTDRAASGTIYVPLSSKFKCQHDHCAGRHAADMPERLDWLLRDQSGGLVCFRDVEWGELSEAEVPTEARMRASVGKGFQRGPGSVLSGNPGADIHDADPTEDGLALAFCDRYHARLRFNRTSKHWHVWDGHTWTPDGDHLAFDWARRVTRDYRGAQERDIRALGKASSATAINKAASNDPRMSVAQDEFDQDPWRAGTPGDEMLLATGTSTPPDPANLLTKKLLVEPAPKGTQAPVWDKFMWDTFGGDIELIDFVYRWFGYCLSGDVSAEVFVFLYGTGGNGKGVLLHAISAIAGDYAWKIDERVLMQQKHPGHETEIAQLAGKRLVITSELPDGAAFNLTKLKNLTGNEGVLGAHYMRQDHFQFRPVHKLVLVGNHKPRLDHVDPAIRRRLVLIPFLHRPPSPDPTLKVQLVPEYPAILRRLLDGCAEVHNTLARGVSFTSLVPASVDAASLTYLIEQDITALWCQERCYADVQGAIGVTVGFNDYQNWCAEEGQLCNTNSRMFGAAVIRAGEMLGIPIASAHTDRGNVLRGLQLKARD